MSRSDRPRWRIHNWLRAAVATLVFGAVSWPLVYGLAVLISPPHDSEGHKLMPIGQALLATVLSPIFGLLSGWLIGRPSDTRA